MYLYLYIGVYFPSCTYTQDIQYVLRSAYKWVSGVKNGGRILCTIQTVCCRCCCWTWFRWKLGEGARVSALRKPVWSACKMIVFAIFLYTNKDLFLLGPLLSTVMSFLVWGPEEPMGWFYSGWVTALILCVPGEVSEVTPLFIIIFKWVSKSWCCLCYLERDAASK